MFSLHISYLPMNVSSPGSGVSQPVSSFFFLSKELWKKVAASVEIRYLEKGRGGFFRQGQAAETIFIF